MGRPSRPKAPRVIRGFFKSFGKRRGKPAAAAPAPAPAPEIPKLQLDQTDTPGGVMRLARTDEGGVRGCLRGPTLYAYLCAALEWSTVETHAMLFIWICPPVFARKPYEEQVASPIVRFNPFYWFCFLCTIPFLVLGLIFHDLLGQGPADFLDTPRSGTASPRSMEVHEAEKHIRVHWLYITDGFYILELCVGLADMCVLVYYGLRSWSAELTEILGNDIVLPICMISGNVFFLTAIHKKRHWTTRYFILVNCAYASAKVVEFIFGLYVLFKLGAPKKYAYLIMSYCAETAMFVLAVVIYSKLWFAYEDIAYEARQESGAAAATAPDSEGGQGDSTRGGARPVLHHVHAAIDGVSGLAERQQARDKRVRMGCCGHAQEWPVFTLVLLLVTCAVIWSSMFATLMLRAGWFSDATRESLEEAGSELHP